MKVIVKTKLMLGIFGGIMLMLIVSFLISLLLSPRGYYPDAQRYEYQVADSVLINALMRVKDKYPNVFVDSSEKLLNDFTSPKSKEFYSTLYLKSRNFNIYYCFSFIQRKLGTTTTTLYFYAVTRKGGYKRDFLNRDLDEQESKKYIDDFELSLLPLIEREMKGVKRME